MELVYLIVGVALGIGVAFACMMFFCRGIKVGMAVERKEEPPLIIPQKAEPPTEEEKKTADDMYQKINVLMGYDPYEVN